MSRTLRNKIRIGICTGSNTEFYRARNKWQRRKNRHELRNKLANYDKDDLDDVLNFTKLPKKDTWEEPTDGSKLIDRLFIQQLENRHRQSTALLFRKKYGKYLKKSRDGAEVAYQDLA